MVWNNFMMHLCIVATLCFFKITSPRNYYYCDQDDFPWVYGSKYASKSNCCHRHLVLYISDVKKFPYLPKIYISAIMRRDDRLSYVVAITLWKNWVQVWLTRALGMIALLQNTTSFIYFRVLTIFTGVPELIYILHISSLGQLQGRSDDPQAALKHR